MHGGIRLYLCKDMTNVNILNHTCICKSCYCSKCDFGSMFISFTFQRNECILRVIYRYPNGNMKHFVEDLERTLICISWNASFIFAGDINIDIIKFEHEGTMNYLATLVSYNFVPHITLPSVITSYSATCMEQIFVQISDNDIASGLFFQWFNGSPPLFCIS